MENSDKAEIFCLIVYFFKRQGCENNEFEMFSKTSNHFFKHNGYETAEFTYFLRFFLSKSSKHFFFMQIYQSAKVVSVLVESQQLAN